MNLVETILHSPGLLAALGTLLGGILLKLLERYLSKHAIERDDRKDYRAEIKELTDRQDVVEKEVTFWRGRFYEEQEDNALLRVMMIQNGMTPPNKKVDPPA